MEETLYLRNKLAIYVQSLLKCDSEDSLFDSETAS